MKEQTFHSLNDLGESMGISVKKPAVLPPAATAGHGAPARKMPEFLQDSADYVAIASERIKRLGRPDRRFPDRLNFGNLTTSKIRNILSLVNRLYNRVLLENGDLPAGLVDDIRYMKIRLVYESGREPAVKRFCESTGIIDAVDCIGSSRKRFLRYAKYMEALVAYHRFYGGKDE